MASSKSKSVNNLERINAEITLLLDADEGLTPIEREAFRKSALDLYRLQIEHTEKAHAVNVGFKKEIEKLAVAINYSDTSS